MGGNIFHNNFQISQIFTIKIIISRIENSKHQTSHQRDLMGLFSKYGVELTLFSRNL